MSVFVSRSPGGNPLDTLDEAAAVLETLNSFISECRDLSCFSRMGENRSMDGLNVLFGGLSRAIDHAANELSGVIFSSDEARTIFHDMMAQKREELEAEDDQDGPDFEQTMADHENYPRILNAREAAILATIRKGYSIEDIGFAVNMKRKTVEAIIKRLVQQGEFDPETGAAETPADTGAAVAAKPGARSPKLTEQPEPGKKQRAAC